MANASPCMPSGALAQVFFPPGGSSPPGSAVIQQGTPISMPSMPAGFPVMDLTPGQAPGGAVIPSLPPTPAGVSFIIQIGLTRESVLMPQSADLAYVKQIACSIVDTKVGNVCVCVSVNWASTFSRWKAVYVQSSYGTLSYMYSSSSSIIRLFFHSLFLYLVVPQNSLFTLYYSHR